MGIFDTPRGDCTQEYPIENPHGSHTNSMVFRGINEPNCVCIVLQFILCDSGKIVVTRKSKMGMQPSDRTK